MTIGFGFEDIVKEETNKTIWKPFKLNSFRTTSSGT